MSDAVKAIQQRLKSEGFDPGPIDGEMGPKTQAALNAEAASQGRPVGQGSGHSSDWSDADLTAIGAIFKILGTTPEAVFPVMMFESGAKPYAQNPRAGHATGLLQWMDFNLKPWGYTPDEFKQLSISDQLPYVLKYFMPHKGQLVNSTAVYMLVWQPAYVEHADDPTWTHPTWNKDYVYGKGVVPGSGGSPNNVYNQNSGFDKTKRGYIIVGDLKDTADRMLPYPRTQELIARTNALMGRAGTAIKIGGTGLIALAGGLGLGAAWLANKYL